MKEIELLIEEVKRIYKEKIGDEVNISNQTKLIEDLEFDSIDIMELFVWIEEEYEVDFTDLEDFSIRFNEIGLLVDGMKELLESKK